MVANDLASESIKAYWLLPPVGANRCTAHVSSGYARLQKTYTMPLLALPLIYSRVPQPCTTLHFNSVRVQSWVTPKRPFQPPPRDILR